MNDNAYNPADDNAATISRLLEQRDKLTRALNVLGHTDEVPTMTEAALESVTLHDFATAPVFDVTQEDDRRTEVVETEGDDDYVESPAARQMNEVRGEEIHGTPPANVPGAVPHVTPAPVPPVGTNVPPVTPAPVSTPLFDARQAFYGMSTVERNILIALAGTPLKMTDLTESVNRLLPGRDVSHMTIRRRLYGSGDVQSPAPGSLMERFVKSTDPTRQRGIKFTLTDDGRAIVNEGAKIARGE